MRQKPKKQKSHPFGSAVLVTLMAVVCIGGAELVVARYADPALYESITAPVRDACESIRSDISEYIAQCKAERARRLEEERKLEEERQREEERKRRQRERELAATELAVQLASKPAIEEDLPPADPSATELIEEDGCELLTGGNIRLVYFNQADEIWANEPFGSDPIGGYGCGPTTLAMVAASLVDASATPASVAAWSASAGYCAPRSGSYLSIVEGTAKHYGLSCIPLGAANADTICGQLSAGNIIVALMGPGHFTSRGHFILLHGLTLSGEILVADPNSRENSLTVWDPAVIVSELSQSRNDGAPLWAIVPEG